MKNLKQIFIACTFIVALASCSVTKPYAITENPIGNKKGVSSSLYIFNLELNGKFGITEACKKGKIKGGVSTVDIKTTYYFGPLVWKREMIVTGAGE